MSVSILEVIEAGGYNPTADASDARWLLGQDETWQELQDGARELVEKQDTIDEIDEMRERLQFEAMDDDERVDTTQALKLTTNFYYKWYMKGELENARRN